MKSEFIQVPVVFVGLVKSASRSAPKVSQKLLNRALEYIDPLCLEMVEEGGLAKVWKKIANDLQEQLAENEHELEQANDRLEVFDYLEDWSIRAAAAIQETVDDAQAGSADPEGDDAAPDLRELLEEHSNLMRGAS